MTILIHLLKAFAVGGAICAFGELLVLRTKLTPARILVLFVVCGVVLTAVGVYDKIVDFAGAGATVPIVGFGYSLAKGVREVVAANGFLGALGGGLRATAVGVTAAVFLGYVIALVAKPGDKS